MIRRLRIALTAFACASLAAAGGCSSEQRPPEPAPETRFAAALGTIGGGSGASGVGWVEPGLIEAGRSRVELISDALGPNAGSAVEAARTLERRFGFDPLSAKRLVSIGGSYAFGIRADRVAGEGLERVLGSVGEPAGRAGSFDLIDAESYASVPRPLVSAGVQGLGAFDAFAEESVVLAISERARSALLGEGSARIDAPIYAAAAECLGDVVAARLTPDANLVSTDLGITLVAAGVRADGREVICTLGGDAALAAGIEVNLRRLLSPEARDPITGEPFARWLAAVEVDGGTPYGIEAVRSVLEPLPRAEPGQVFDLVSGAGVVGLINGEGRTFEPFGDVGGSDPGGG